MVTSGDNRRVGLSLSLFRFYVTKRIGKRKRKNKLFRDGECLRRTVTDFLFLQFVIDG